MMQTYVCRQCDGAITVGHPKSRFRRQARTLARESVSLFKRLLRPGKVRRQISDALTEQYYLESEHYRELPGVCPGCGFGGKDDLSWWRPGVTLDE